MADDAIRSLLAHIKPENTIRTEPGMVAILRARVIEGGGEPDRVAKWVEEQGGYVDQTLPPPGGRRGGGKAQVEVFFAVPRQALAG